MNGSYLVPIITGARNLPGLDLSADDFSHLVEQGRPSFLIHTTEPVEELPESLQPYLKRGVERDVHQRFKCRNREPWYAVPSVWPADALLLRQAGDMPRLVHLSQKCASTDTIHRVRWLDPALGKRFAVGFLNTWTLIVCELTGRSYGGGVLELMPSEANALPVPPPLEELDEIFSPVDSLVRLRQLDAAVEAIDRIVNLPHLSREQYETARYIHAKLITRRKLKHNGNH